MVSEIGIYLFFWWIGCKCDFLNKAGIMGKFWLDNMCLPLSKVAFFVPKNPSNCWLKVHLWMTGLQHWNFCSTACKSTIARRCIISLLKFEAMQQKIAYSCNKITKTWIQISCFYWFWLFLTYCPSDDDLTSPSSFYIKKQVVCINTKNFKNLL